MEYSRKELSAKAMEYAATDAGRVFRLLLETWITDLRKKNDTAELKDFPKNQGAIKEMKLMLKAITPHQQIKEFDGSYAA
jgi:hypothetical protein